MKDGVAEGFLQGDADDQAAGFVGEIEAGEILEEVADKGGHERGVVFDAEFGNAAAQGGQGLAMLAFGAGDFEDFGDGLAQVAGEVGFVDVTGGAAAQGEGSDFIGTEGSHQNDGEIGMFFFEATDEGEAIDVGHLEIGENQIGEMIGDGDEGVGAVGGVGDVDVAEFFEETRDEIARDGIVVNHQYAGHLYPLRQKFILATEGTEDTEEESKWPPATTSCRTLFSVLA